MLLYTPPPRTDPWLLKHYNYNGISSSVVDIIIVGNTGVWFETTYDRRRGILFIYIGTHRTLVRDRYSNRYNIPRDGILITRPLPPIRISNKRYYYNIILRVCILYSGESGVLILVRNRYLYSYMVITASLVRRLTRRRRHNRRQLASAYYFILPSGHATF